MTKMKFETAAQTAERLGVNIRTIQKWAKNGNLKGAEKCGRDWMIPADAVFGQSVAHVDGETEFMPFSIAYFENGKGLEYTKTIKNETERKIALGEYYYHKGECEKAVEILEEFLDCEIADYRMTALVICTFSYMAMGHSHLAKMAVNSIGKNLEELKEIYSSKEAEAKEVFTSSLVSTLLHFSFYRIPSLENHVGFLEDGAKLLALYTVAYQAYLNKDYSRAYGIAEASLLISPQKFPIAYIHINIIAAICLVNLSETEEAKRHLKTAWKLAFEDRFYQPFAEHHTVLHGLLENYLKKEFPEDYGKIIEIAKNYGKSWRKVHNELMQKTVADNLTTTEFIVATLYYRNWRIKEIAVHMHLSEKTIKNYLQIVYQKLGINDKKGLKEFMLS